MTGGPLIDLGREIVHLPLDVLNLMKIAAWSAVGAFWLLLALIVFVVVRVTRR